MYNMFGDFGIFGDALGPIIEEKEKKKEKKEKKQGKEGSKAEMYKGPFKIVFDSLSLVEFNEEREYSKKEILDVVDQLHKCQIFSSHESEFTLNKLDKEMYLLRPSYSSRCEKGNAGKRLLLQQLTDLAQIVEPDEKGEITVESVKSFISETYGVDVVLHLIDDVYIPEGCIIKPSSIEGIRFPVRVKALTLFGEVLEIEEDDYNAFELENMKQDAGLLQDEIAGESTMDDQKEDMAISENALKNLLATFLPEYANDLQYAYDQEKEILQVLHKSISSIGSQKVPSVKQEEMYPSNAVVSLVFTRLQLSSDLFGGRQKITKKELLKYIGKQYPEYSPERTEITFDEKANLILPILKSGKRGLYQLDDKEEYRREDTELMSICVKKERADYYGCVPGIVYFNLPKIPFDILKEIMHFFWDEYVSRGTEAIAQIYFRKKEAEYEIYYPRQLATVGSVEFERDPEREMDPMKILVMEIHSHGGYAAMWSPTDNEEELAHRLYAVVGELPRFRYDNDHIRIRAATGGYYVRMELGEIFEIPEQIRR